MTKGRKVESIILRVLIFAAAAATFAVLFVPACLYFDKWTSEYQALFILIGV